jgi:hypothetical protein
VKEEYKQKLIRLAKDLDSTMVNGTSQIVDIEYYVEKVKSKANYLVGYILALEELETNQNK